MAGSASCLVFYVNGKKVTDRAPDPELTLLRYLREKLRLCGTKLGCAEGGCGACTVMISKLDRSSGSVKHFAVNACLAPICSVHGLAVTTVEGIGSTKTRLHPVQERIAKAHGSQCGFCTPGIVMSMYALLRSSPKPNMKDLEVAFQGNLCRCTGYRPIIEGYRTFTDNACGMGEKCCKLSGNECGVEIDDKLFEPSEFAPLDPSQEPIFPPELKLNDAYDTETLTFTSERNVVWFRPTSLAELLQFKKNQPEAKIVVGNTEVGIEVKSKNFDYKFLVNPTHIKELKAITLTDEGMKVGSAVTLIELQEALQEQIEALPEHETRLYRAIVEMLHWFAGKQIRNVASVGGNIMTGSPISDLNPIFMAASTSLEVESLEGGKRNVKMDGKFFSAYRQNIIDDAEVLISLFIPRTSASQHFLAYKQAKRRDDDIAIVNGAFYVRFVDGTNIVEETQFAFGGMAATTVLTPQTSANVKGRAWDRNLIELVNKSLVAELPLSADAPGGMILYRRSLTLSLFFKAFLSIGQSLEATLGLSLVDERERSGADNFHTLPAKSTQLYEKVSADQPSTDPIRRPKIHSSGLKQATGEAIYCDDMPKHANELYLSFVLSTKAHAKLISLDASEALKLQGVHAFFCAKDLPSEQNTMGPMYIDEEVFISEVVTSHGQLLAAIAADSQMIAQRAAKLVKVVYEEISPVIVSIDDAIKFDSYFPGYPKITESGDVHKAFEEADHQASGELRVGGQEHFYLETHSCVAIPKDTDELEVFSSTQQPADLQRRIALLLQIPMNRVVLRVKRIGGGFGGKETRAGVIALPVAWVAWKLGRPIRIMLDRDEDMLITAGRNPFLFKYKAAFNANGKITGCDIEAFNNAGYSMDYSFLVMEKAMQGMTNAYNIPNVRIKSAVMKTNLPSNTAFRGFGSPQGMLLAEHVIRHVAKVTQRDYLEVMAINMCRTGDVTHFGQLLESCMNVRCFEEVKKSAELDRRSLEVEEFNLRNRWKKRGISLTNTMFGVGFPPKFLNQGGALINIYVDGSVLIAHGGVEMGQGLHTKMIQIASNLLKIPIEKFHVQETSTDKVPNAVSTAASVSSDLYGGAVIEACNILNSRLAPFREEFAELGWDKMIFKAYFERVSLSATGYFATLDIGPEIGKPNNYFTHGAAVTEVEIDCLTGDHQTVRTDIVMDIGSSLNPAIDIGQIEGAFMQGYGMFTLEELIYSPEGALLSRGPGTYKVPGFGDIPAEFNVSLLTGAPNPRACYSSKAVGEPPLFLASSAFFAIKEAISAARKEENLDPDFYMPSPATSARIRMACQDEITKNFDEPEEGTFKPWNVVP